MFGGKPFLERKSNKICTAQELSLSLSSHQNLQNTMVMQHIHEWYKNINTKYWWNKNKNLTPMYEYSMCRTISWHVCCACCSGRRFFCPGKWSSLPKITTMFYFLWVHQHKFTVAILKGVISRMQVLATLVAISRLMALIRWCFYQWLRLFDLKCIVALVNLSLDVSLIWNFF